MPLARDTDLTSGSLRGITGRLERVRLNSMSFTSTGSGAQAYLDVGGSATANKDGSASRMILSTPVTTLPAMASGRGVVYGRVVGVRFTRTNSVPPFDVVIDGVAYPIDDVLTRRNNVVVNATDNECFVIVADSLEDRLHTVEVHLATDVAAAQTLFVLGFLGESGRGYSTASELRAGTTPAAPTALTTTASGVVSPNLAVGWTFFNTDTVDRLVTIAISSASYLAITVPAGRSVSHSFPSPRSVSTYQVKADAPGVVNSWLEFI